MRESDTITVWCTRHRMQVAVDMHHVRHGDVCDSPAFILRCEVRTTPERALTWLHMEAFNDAAEAFSAGMAEWDKEGE